MKNYTAFLLSILTFSCYDEQNSNFLDAGNCGGISGTTFGGSNVGGFSGNHFTGGNGGSTGGKEDLNNMGGQSGSSGNQNSSGAGGKNNLSCREGLNKPFLIKYKKLSGNCMELNNDLVPSLQEDNSLVPRSCSVTYNNWSSNSCAHTISFVCKKFVDTSYIDINIFQTDLLAKELTGFFVWKDIYNTPYENDSCYSTYELTIKSMP